jgi:RNA polymerase sigma factor (sigma-70 family)
MVTHREARNPRITSATAKHLIEFQENGKSGTFARFWADAQAYVERTASRVLAKHFVTKMDGSADLAALDDVSQSIATALLQLPRNEKRQGWFKLDPRRNPADGLRGWLFNVTRNAAVSYCRKNRMKRGSVSTTAISDFELNAPLAAAWAFKTEDKASIEEEEIREIVATCVAELDSAMLELYRLRYIECVPVRNAAKDLGIAASTVTCHEKTLLRRVAARLLSRGIDSSVFDQPA